MKKKIKGFLRKLFRKYAFLRTAVYKLNKVAREEEPIRVDNAVRPVRPKREEIFTEKAMFRGNSIDYLNSRLLSKEERERELKILFYRHCGYYLDLENPQTFNQKLQWLKMNYYDPLLARCVDKYEFKKYIEEQLGEGYTVPLYGVWEHENHVDFSQLPDKFVLKSTVQSDGKHIVVIKDKNTVDIDKLKTTMSIWLQPRNTLCASYCCAYKEVKPRIIAEQFIEGFDESLTDYKFMCFNGEAKLLFTVADRKKKMCVNFYDLDWNLLPFTRKYPVTNYPLEKPKHFDKMLEIANKLAKPFPFVRVDFYEDGDRVYVGELTFYPGGGYEGFDPIEWDYKLGGMLNLPQANI